jgi:alkanesulfonate monooxygenase SsuD/methylene tetrahydromethanopterin reductase-like flavin-dependent oxidoreductase (luciferase family)
MGAIDELVELARTAEEAGFDAIALPDSVSGSAGPQRNSSGAAFRSPSAAPASTK